jgi:predicted  nucleic acid-binding Zn-ribbon protein
MPSPYVCVRCGCTDTTHDPLLGYCLDPDCGCLQFVSEADELENNLAMGELPEELNFDDDAA